MSTFKIGDKVILPEEKAILFYDEWRKEYMR